MAGIAEAQILRHAGRRRLPDQDRPRRSRSSRSIQELSRARPAPTYAVARIDGDIVGGKFAGAPPGLALPHGQRLPGLRPPMLRDDGGELARELRRLRPVAQERLAEFRRRVDLRIHQNRRAQQQSPQPSRIAGRSRSTSIRERRDDTTDIPTSRRAGVRAPRSRSSTQRSERKRVTCAPVENGAVVPALRGPTTAMDVNASRQPLATKTALGSPIHRAWTIIVPDRCRARAMST